MKSEAVSEAQKTKNYINLRLEPNNPSSTYRQLLQIIQSFFYTRKQSTKEENLIRLTSGNGGSSSSPHKSNVRFVIAIRRSFLLLSSALSHQPKIKTSLQ